MLKSKPRSRKRHNLTLLHHLQQPLKHERVDPPVDEEHYVSIGNECISRSVTIKWVTVDKSMMRGVSVVSIVMKIVQERAWPLLLPPFEHASRHAPSLDS